ncbi:hypothetical protein ACFY8C_36125 [Streptomyces flavochromogenes]|uniref:Uncharacterized protein n=1 Tax=Streptomyces flavochromogenes TaxID=68199 RepID=A0ABW6Y1R0_9ACTN|nr:hypothetical protein [Streptomyces flavochromogenes]
MNSSVRSVRWLASVCDDPAVCLSEWRLSERGVVLLPAGRLWDALAVPEALGHSLLNAVARCGRSTTGPVLRDSRRRELLLLMTPGSPVTRPGRAARYLTTGTWLAVPDPGRRVTGLSWLVPPDGRGTLFSPHEVYAALEPRAGR